MKFGDRLSPALDIGFGKWFTPASVYASCIAD